MTIDLSVLKDQSRLLFEIELKPRQGQRFQPTGFPNLGAATFKSKEGNSLLVESAQSMANRLEATIWDDGANDLKPDFKGLSYVEVKGSDGKFLTSSILEAHRLNSVYIEAADNGALHARVATESNYSEKGPIDRGAFLNTILKYDVNSLLHGTFLESIGGRLRVARALSCFIESTGALVVASGGVKNDRVMPGKEEGKDAAAGYGNVPFSRDEYTAEKTTLFVNLDLAQIRGYGLGEDVEKLLVLLALFKLRSLIDGDLRLRTACDFEPKEGDSVLATRPKGWTLPEASALKVDLQKAIAATKSKMERSSVTYSGAKKKAKKDENATTELVSEDTEGDEGGVTG
jgi:CRISPR-associated protein Csb1